MFFQNDQNRLEFSDLNPRTKGFNLVLTLKLRVSLSFTPVFIFYGNVQCYASQFESLNFYLKWMSESEKLILKLKKAFCN